jgi:hypothetical protein
VPRYYFDIRDGDEFAPDCEGTELSSIQGVQEEAARSLADMARDAIHHQHDGARHEMAIEVRDDNGPVLTVEVSFEAKRHRLDA